MRQPFVNSEPPKFIYDRKFFGLLIFNYTLTGLHAIKRSTGFNIPEVDNRVFEYKRK